MNATRVLIIAFVAGLVLILSLRIWVPGLPGATLAASAAVVVILLVGLYYYRVSGEDSEDRQIAGDNLYYLGLLYTLCSLIMALLQLFVFDIQEDVNERANELIGNFGIALSSTVAGILARILFQSSHKVKQGEPAESQRLATGNLPHGIDELAIESEIIELREELSRLHLVLREASDSFLHFSRISSEQFESFVVHTGEMMQRQSEDMNKTSAHQLEQVSIRLDTVANRGIVETSQAWSDAAAAMKSDGERHIKAIYGDLNGLLQSTEQIWSGVSSLSHSIGESVAGMRENAESLQTMVKASAAAGMEMRSLLESMSSARNELAAMADAANKSVRDLSTGMREVVDGQVKAVVELSEARQNAVREYGKATAQIADSLAEQVETDGDRMRTAILKVTDDLENHQRVGEGQLAQAQQLNKQMEGEAREWSKLAEHTRKSLVEAVERLVGAVSKN